MEALDEYVRLQAKDIGEERVVHTIEVATAKLTVLTEIYKELTWLKGAC